ncbi:MAG: hypothetical protein ACFFC1_20305, partial [Promethearchaeota archaeon]
DALSIVRKRTEEFILNQDVEFSANEIFLRDLFSKEKLDTLTRYILSYIEKIPIEYLIFIPFPSIENMREDEIKISDNLSIFKIVTNSDYEYFIELFKDTEVHQSHFLQGKVFLKLNINGYINDLKDTVTIENAISLLKQFIHLGTIIGFFSERGFFETIFEPQYDPLMFAFENESTPIHIRNFIFDNSLRDYLRRIKIDEKENQVELNINSEKLKLLSKVFNSNDEFVETILAASEWGINSRLNENKTFSFIQICIGLEAILGKGLSENLTKMLSDRCSYLIGKNYKERNKIRDKFEKLYEIRSKLVHGRKSQIVLNDAEYLFWGRKTLDQIILKEINTI